MELLRPHVRLSRQPLYISCPESDPGCCVGLKQERLSYHCLTALSAHLVSYNMTWGATAKDLEDSNFFIEVPAIFKKHWLQLTICTLCLGGWIVLAIDVLPIEWQAHGGFTVFWCPTLLASMHLLFHVLLNPQLLRFSF